MPDLGAAKTVRIENRKAKLEKRKLKFGKRDDFARMKRPARASGAGAIERENAS